MTRNHTDDSTHEVFHYPYSLSWLQPGKLLSRSSTRDQGAALWTHLSVTWESTAGTTVWKSSGFQLPFLWVSVSHFWLQTGSKRHHNPPCPGASDTSSWVCVDPRQRFIHSSWEREQSLPRQKPQHCWAINNWEKTPKPQSQPTSLVVEFCALHYTPCYWITSGNPH